MSIVGTPNYMAPEQVRGEPLDARSDLFAMGGARLRDAVGATAFTGATLVDVLHAVLHEQPPALIGRRGRWPAFDRVVHRALHKQAADR